MTEPSLQLSHSVALHISLPCQLEEVRRAALRLSDFLREQGLGMEEVQACELAAVEACNNAVQYAGSAPGKEPISLDVLCAEEAIELRIGDHTGGFDWPDEVTLPAADEERGRGLFLINNLMDEVRYFRGKQANCLVLRKHRQDAQKTLVVPVLQHLTHQLRESEQIISDMAEELSFCYESLSAIFRCSAELGRTHAFKEFSERLLSDLAQITSADWFVLRLVSRDRSNLSVLTASEPKLKLPPLSLSVASESLSLEIKAALSRQDLWFEGGGSFEEGDPLNVLASGSMGLIHPFCMGEQLIGTVTIGKAAGRSQFTAIHANVIHTFADFLGIQIANARIQEEQVHARLVSRELEIAKTIQRSLLPKFLPHIPGFRLAGFCESAQEVGGDFYDVLAFDEKSVLLIIADVMGKGVPAAMFAAILRSLLRAVPEWINQPAHLLSRVNRLLFRELSGVDMFITAQLVFVDTSERKLVAASAGHCPILVTGATAADVKIISPEGLPLGIVAEGSFGCEVQPIAQDSRLLLYTDGLTEARNPEGEFFGQDRLVNWFRGAGRASAEELKTDLASELGNFQSSAAIHDDQTFLIMA